MKNFFFVKENQTEYFDFCQKSRDFYDFLIEQDRSSFDKDSFIERPYSFQMTREFAEGLGMDLSIMDSSPYFSNIFRFFFTHPTKSWLPPHLDTITDKGVCPASMNFPLRNCDERTETLWQKVVSGKPNLTQNFGGEIKSKIAANFTPEAKECELEVVERAFFFDDQPHLFRTNRWHEVVNTSGELRLISTILFDPPMLWEDIVDHFKGKEII